MDDFTKVQNMVATLFEAPLESVTLQSSKDDFVLWDSLNHLNLIMEIESEFNVSIGIEEIAEIRTIKGIMDLLERHRNK